MKTKKLTVAELAALVITPATVKWQPTEEQKIQWQSEEPTAPQVTALERLGVQSDTILTLNKYDASELIETLKAKQELARRKPKSLSKGQEIGLIKWGFAPDQIAHLSYYEASELLDAKKKAAGR